MSYTEPKRLLAPRDAAAVLGVHPDTLARWCDGDAHPALRDAMVRLPSGHRRYDAAKIEAFVETLRGAA